MICGAERASEGWDTIKDFVEGAGAPVDGSSSFPCSRSCKKSEAGSPSNLPQDLFVYTGEDTLELSVRKVYNTYIHPVFSPYLQGVHTQQEFRTPLQIVS